MFSKTLLFSKIILFSVIMLSFLFLSSNFAGQTNDPSKTIFFEDFDPAKSEDLIFKGYLLFGTDGAWSGSVENGKYILENRDDKGAIRYYYILPDTGQTLGGGSEVSVEIDGNFSKDEFDSGAGLIFDVNPEIRHYIAFVIMNRNEYGILKRDENGLQIKMRGTHSAILKGKPNCLSILSENQTLVFKINQEQIGSLGHEPGKANGIGLLALGTGRFAFDNFRFASKKTEQLDLQKTHTGEDKQEPYGQKKDSVVLSRLSPPEGFNPVETQAGSGHAWVYNNRSALSAREALFETVNQLHKSQLDKISLYSAISDLNDLEIRALFGADSPMGPVRGMLIAAKSDKGFISACLFDSPANLVTTINPLIRSVSKHLPVLYGENPSPPNIQWKQAMIPDGSGKLMLPSDWEIMGGHKGMVDAGGQDGSRVSLGIWAPVLAQDIDPYYRQLPGGGSLISAPYTDPVTALQQVFPQMIPNMPQKILRVYSSSPTPWPNGGQAAYCHFDWQLGEGGQAQTFTSFALVGVMPGMGQWTFYISVASAPPALFARNLPMLLEIWKSWDVAGYVHQERLNNAMNDMKEIGNIINQSYNYRQRSQDRIAANWTEVIRDQTFLQDRELGSNYEVPLTSVQDWTRSLNEAAGYERYRHVPLRDIQ